MTYKLYSFCIKKKRFMADYAASLVRLKRLAEGFNFSLAWCWVNTNLSEGGSQSIRSSCSSLSAPPDPRSTVPGGWTASRR